MITNITHVGCKLHWNFQRTFCQPFHIKSMWTSPESIVQSDWTTMTILGSVGFVLVDKQGVSQRHKTIFRIYIYISHNMDTGLFVLCCVAKWAVRCWFMQSNHLYILDTLKPRQNGRHFPDDSFNWIFLNENIWIFGCNFIEVCSYGSN